MAHGHPATWGLRGHPWFVWGGRKPPPGAPRAPPPSAATHFPFSFICFFVFVLLCLWFFNFFFEFISFNIFYL